MTTELAPDDDDSLGPDLDPPVDPFPATPRGDVLRQINALTIATANARAIAEQYAATVQVNEGRLADLRAQLDALPDDEEA